MKAVSLQLSRFTLTRAVWISLALLCVLFVAAHLRPGGLNPIHSRISNYAATAPWGVLISGCIVLLGAIYLIVAFGIVRSLPHNTATALAALLLAVGGSQLFFVARYPIKSTSYTETLLDDFTGRNVAHWKADARAEVAQEVHNLTIGITLTALVLALAALARGLRDSPPHAKVRTICAALLTPMILLFLLSHYHEAMAGLWQRLGFVVVVAWIASAGRSLCEPRDLPP